MPFQQPLGRRATNASLNTTSSNSDLTHGKTEDGGELENVAPGSINPNSLRDRFKLVRMREEAGVTSLDDAHDTNGSATSPARGLFGRSASIAFGVGHAPTLGEDKNELQPLSMNRNASSPGLTHIRRASLNPNLAPGTAAGMAAGPDESGPVDWDLWQAVVYEGPAAVARTSPEELHQAIASGIPQAIRGVVWQVLAQSKNEELEGVYRELVARGTDKESTLR